MITTQVQLVRQGVEWLKANRDDLLEAMTDGMIEVARSFTYTRTDQEWRQVAMNYFGTLLKRLEETTYPHEEVKTAFVRFLRSGTQAQSFLDATSNFSKIIIARAHQALAAQPEVRDALSSKIDYVTNLLKASVGAAMIEVSESKPETGA